MDGWKPLFYAAVNNNMGFESLSKVPNRQTDKGTRFDFFFLFCLFFSRLRLLGDCSRSADWILTLFFFYTRYEIGFSRLCDYVST